MGVGRSSTGSAEVARSRRPRRLEDAVRGSVVVLTGASSGIGAATARRLGGAGATVALIARRREQLDEVALAVTAAGGQATVHPCDLTDAAAIAATADGIAAEHGRVDVLVNNAECRSGAACATPTTGCTTTSAPSGSTTSALYS